MPITYGNANYRKKFDAFRIVDQSGHEPLKEAIACALRLREVSESIAKQAKVAKLPEARLIASQATCQAIAEELRAWKGIAEFIYSKPKHVEVSAHISYEDFVTGSYKDMIANGNGNGNGHG